MAVTCAPGEATPPLTWNQSLHPVRASHHALITLPSLAMVKRSRWSE
jgi:hypothetical protein